MFVDQVNPMNRSEMEVVSNNNWSLKFSAMMTVKDVNNNALLKRPMTIEEQLHKTMLNINATDI